MRKFVLLAGLAGALLTMGACADAPTSPDQQQRRAPDLAPGAPVQDTQVQGCVTDGLCILEPIVVDPCDPWEALDWCSGN
jgi:hypothetical protein